jgi:hypothetical protein
MLTPIAIPNHIIHNFQAVLYLSGWGWLGGIFSGMIGLWEYSIWHNMNPPLAKIKKASQILYLTPISGAIMALLPGIIYQQFSGDYNLENIEGLKNIFALMIGFFQFQILNSIFAFIEKRNSI